MIIKPAAICTVEAPCKINLHLGIGEKRPDGFHTVESLFASLALGDTLRFECMEDEGNCTLSMNWEAPEEAIPQADNLILRAISLFRERTNFRNALAVTVTKRIPAGAGLGGGSSDAASSLLALNCLAGAALPMDDLLEMAAFLGSDVPFFLSGGAAYVGGRGESIEPVEIPQGLWVILFKPPFSSDTSSAFRLLDKAREHQIGEKMPHVHPKNALSKEELIKALANDCGNWPFYNDFLPVFLDSGFFREKEEADSYITTNAGVYRLILDALRDAGASFTGLSGSGSCCFGVFRTEDEARKAEKQLCRAKFQSFPAFQGSRSQGIFIRLTFFLARRSNPVLQY